VADFSFNKPSQTFSHLWPWFFFAAAFESLLAALALLLVPSESGVSLARMALLGVLALFFFCGIYLGFIARRASFRFDQYTPAIILSALLFLTSGLIMFLLRYLAPDRLTPYYERLSPLLWYLLAVGVQATIFLALLKYGFHPQEFSKRKPIYTSAFFAFPILISAFAFVAATKIGITPDTAYWGEPGVAMLGWQFILSILIGFFILHSSFLFPQPATRILQPAILYLVALALWLSVPIDVLKNSFYSPITPPTNMPFPYSDAGFYDYLSQSLLIGTNYVGGIPPRPLYVVFLASLHFFFGQNYPAIIAAQTCVLALFPVALYFLAKKLHSPAAGVTVALFAIFRELVNLWISSNARASNSKTFTTDFPTAMALAALCLVLVWWLEKRDLKSTLIAGGFFGLVLLFRTQSLLVLPLVFIAAFFVYQRQLKEWLIAGAVFALAATLTVLPWLTHNYTVTGKFTFDDPRQMAVIYSQYSLTGNLDLNQFDPEKESVSHRLVSFTLANPVYVSTFIAAHFLNTEIGGLLALPLIEKFDGLSAPVNLYWVAWDGTLAWYNLALLIIYLAVIALGVGAAWQRARWLGLIPLVINLGYAFSNGISRFSSWRYNMPVDWVVYFYFALGAMEILSGVLLLFNSPPYISKGDADLRRERGFLIVFSALICARLRPIRILYGSELFNIHASRPATYIFLLSTFIFIGSTPWLAKGFAAPRYVSTQEQLIAKLEANGSDGKAIRAFLAQPKALLLEGRMLYPRLYHRGEGMSSAHPWPAYAVRDYSRIGFLLLNDNQSNALFVTKELLDFPQGADAILLACQSAEYLDVRAIDFGDKRFQNAPLSAPCADH